jgi:hypothetical protein
MRASIIKSITSAGIAVAAFLLATPATAAECQVRGNPFRYQSETVEQTVSAPGPQGCSRIFRMRGGAMVESVTLVSPARAGRAVVQGFGYFYQPSGGGADSFAVRVSGAGRTGRKGFSIVRVNVLGK